MVKVIRPPLCGDAANETPASQWPVLVSERRRFCREMFPYDCRLLVFFVEDGSKANWLGYQTKEKYLREGLGMDPEVVKVALRGLELIQPDKVAGLDEVVKLGRQGRDNDAPRDDKGKYLHEETKPCITRFGSREHWLARLDRDGYTELAAKVRSGEMSANAAAIGAGFRKKPMKCCPNCGHKW